MSLCWQDPETGGKRKPAKELPLFESSGLKTSALNNRESVAQHGKSQADRPEVARARRNDPATSKQAAASVSLENLGRTKNTILRLLREYGPLTDEQIVDKFYGMASDSGIRTRRKWLVDHGFVCDSGHTGRTASGRASTIWRLCK